MGLDAASVVARSRWGFTFTTGTCDGCGWRGSGVDFGWVEIGPRLHWELASSGLFFAEKTLPGTRVYQPVIFPQSQIPSQRHDLSRSYHNDNLSVDHEHPFLLFSTYSNTVIPHQPCNPSTISNSQTIAKISPAPLLTPNNTSYGKTATHRCIQYNAQAIAHV